jgi:hypoxanthine phosphoribosyltransferase
MIPIFLCFLQLVMQPQCHAASIERLSMGDNIELLISEDEIKSKIAETARTLNAEYKDQELVVVMVMKGAICIAADLIRELEVPCEIEAVTASSYGQRGIHRGELKISGLDELNFTGKNVLLVDDIFDSGQTLSQIVGKLKEKNPKSIKTLVLLEKNVERALSYKPDYVLFHIENRFVVGYGLDYKEYYRGLRGVYVLK